MESSSIAVLSKGKRRKGNLFSGLSKRTVSRRASLSNPMCYIHVFTCVGISACNHFSYISPSYLKALLRFPAAQSAAARAWLSPGDPILTRWVRRGSCRLVTLLSDPISNPGSRRDLAKPRPQYRQGLRLGFGGGRRGREM